jgi:hypothetical protein
MLNDRHWGTQAYSVLVQSAATMMALPAQTLTALHSFDNTDGANPEAPLIQSTDGNFTGQLSTADFPSASVHSFKITPSGALTSLYSFYPIGWRQCEK